MAPVQDHDQENNLESVFPTDSNGESVFFVSSQETQNVGENEILTVIIGETEAPQEVASTSAAPEEIKNDDEVLNQAQTQTEVLTEAPLHTEAETEAPIQTEAQTEVTVEAESITTLPEQATTSQPEETTAKADHAESDVPENVNQEESGVTENVVEQGPDHDVPADVATFAASNQSEEVVNPELPLVVQETTQSTSIEGNEESNEQTTLPNEPESISDESSVTTQDTVQVENVDNEQVQQTEETTTSAHTVVQEETHNENKAPALFSASEVILDVPQELSEATTEGSNEETTTEVVLETKEKPKDEESNKAEISETTDSPRHLNNENVLEETTTVQAPVKAYTSQDDTLNVEKINNEETVETTTAAVEKSQSHNLNNNEVASETTAAPELESSTVVDNLNIPQDAGNKDPAQIQPESVETTTTVQRIIIPQNDVLNDPAPNQPESVETTTTVQRIIIPQNDVLNDPAPNIEESIESVTTVNRLSNTQDDILNNAPLGILEEVESSTGKDVVHDANVDPLNYSQDKTETTTEEVNLKNAELDLATESKAEKNNVSVDPEATTTNADLERDVAVEVTTVEPVKEPIKNLDTKASEESTTLKTETEEIAIKDVSEGDSTTLPSIAVDQDVEQKVEPLAYTASSDKVTTVDTKEVVTEVYLDNEVEKSTVESLKALEEIVTEKADTDNETKDDIEAKEATTVEARAESQNDETTVVPLLYQLKEEQSSVGASSTTVPATTTTAIILESKIAPPEADFKSSHIFEDTTIAFPEERPLIEASVVEEEEPFKVETVNDEAAKIEAVKPQEETVNKGDKIFDETTIAFPVEEDKNIWAPSPNPDDPKTDENGFLIETTTGSGSLNRVAAVHEVVRKSGRHPVKQSTSGEETANDLQEPKEAKDGDEITTTSASNEEEVTTLPAEVNATVSSTEVTKEDESVPFPVTDLLNGIYKFVSSYIKPKPAVKQEVVEKIIEQKVQQKIKQVPVQEEEEEEEEEEDVEEQEAEIEAFPRSTIIGPQPLNSHTLPRDQLIVEAVDEEHSNSDPFFQVSSKLQIIRG